ncbi:uncharacterized protein B0T23DRAFT_397138 [Neurospora hispaniola]|uniref:Uncharacterized protein n=1 Tax=Neurospora hispaniola TaxID=588809 RepID=A0AAJ0I6X7_9PEZI|nr:hypothetical protein B0T23DRAFT_397138 [Neurospora hispaniola]
MDETPPTNLADLVNVTRGPRRARQRLRFEQPQQTPQRTTRSSQAAALEEARRAALRSVGSGFTPEPQPSSTSTPVHPREQSSAMPLPWYLAQSKPGPWSLFTFEGPCVHFPFLEPHLASLRRWPVLALSLTRPEPWFMLALYFQTADLSCLNVFFYFGTTFTC